MGTTAPEDDPRDPGRSWGGTEVPGDLAGGPMGLPAAAAWRYSFLRLQAEGGLGKVWVARDADLNREVALKEVRPEWLDRPQAVRRFLREAQVTGQLEHPNIVPVYELARRPSDGQPFYTMRLLRGRTLQAEVAEHHGRPSGGVVDPLGRQKLLSAFVAVCQAVGYAHSRGVIHRDLKPENVMIGGFGEVVVIDWGLARFVDRPDEPPEEGEADAMAAPALAVSAEAMGLETQGSVGTPAYMAPEQVEGPRDSVDARSDIYGLGAILFEILTGRPPFGGRDLAEVYRRITRDPTPRAREVRPETARPIEAIAAKAMARDPLARYARAADLAEDVQRFLAGEPVSAYREPWTVRARRWVARHRVLATSSAAAASVGALALGVTLANDRARALGSVEALELAQIVNVPTVVEQLRGHRFWVDAPLRARFAAEPDGSPVKLRAGLGLLPVGREPLDYLYGRMLASDDAPTLRVIRSAIGRDHRGEVAGRLRLERRGLGPGARFAASCALAEYDPSAPVAADERAELVAHLMGLLRRNPEGVYAWADLLRPVLPQLAGELIATYAASTTAEAERGVCVRLLIEHARRPEDLAELAQVAEPGDFPGVLAVVLGDGKRVAPLLKRALEVAPPGLDAAAIARRRAQAAVTLGRIGDWGPSWAMLRRAPDPSSRWWLVDRLAPLGADPSALIARLDVEPDPTARRSLLVALGEFDEKGLPDATRARLVASLEARYRADPDAGTHSAVDRLLRRWGRDDLVRLADAQLAGPPRPDRGWFVDRRGVTFAVVRGSVTFAMGATGDETGHIKDLCLLPTHTRTIPRSFAIATKEVTVGQYRPFVEVARARRWECIYNPTAYVEETSPTDDCPINEVSGLNAIAYCRWAGDLEGLEPSYPPSQDVCDAAGKGGALALPADCLDRPGYRLPTEAEWEYACRALSTTPRPFGGGEALLPRFAWSPANSGGRTHPVGLLWPNDLGLFDVLGNIRELCHPPFHFEEEGDAPRVDGPFLDPFDEKTYLAMRGGNYSDLPHFARSSCHQPGTPTERLLTCGFRLARTLP